MNDTFKIRKRKVEGIYKRLESLDPVKHYNRWTNMRNRYIAATDELMISRNVKSQ